MGQRYRCSIAETAIAESAGVRLYDLHTDPQAMVAAAEAGADIAARLGLDAPRPRIAGCAYPHVSTIGCEVKITSDSVEPWVLPCIAAPEDIDGLREPDDYLAAGIVPQRLALLDRLKALRPDCSEHIGHDYEGPVTTAVLMMGQDFFMLPYDDPARAHRLLTFVTRSAVRYARVLRAHQHRTVAGGWQGLCDDFAGIFPPREFAEFVVPYWNMMYEGLQAEHRSCHSELLREEHLRFLADVALEEYDPSVDQYLTPEALKRSCPCAFTLRMWPAEVRDHSASELVAMYRRRAAFEPTIITFALSYLQEEPKIAALLDAAGELA